MKRPIGRVHLVDARTGRPVTETRPTVGAEMRGMGHERDALGAARPSARDVDSVGGMARRRGFPGSLTSRGRCSVGNREAPSPGMDEGDVEVLLLAYEELASNAIRHGRLPVHVMVTTMDDGWLIDVADGATERAPAPHGRPGPGTGRPRPPARRPTLQDARLVDRAQPQTRVGTRSPGRPLGSTRPAERVRAEPIPSLGASPWRNAVPGDFGTVTRVVRPSRSSSTACARLCRGPQPDRALGR